MAFRGWPVEAIEFFEGLEADNSKAYWQDHKAVYEKCVRAPMDELLTELAPEFGEGKVFRPYRDVRFSADKSPYKTEIAAHLAKGGYIRLASNGLGVGSGMYMMSTEQLRRYRDAVGDDKAGVALEKIVAAAAKKSIDITGHESLRSAPRGYPKDHPRIDLLRNKGLVAWREWPVAAWLGTKAPKTKIADFLHAAQPLKDWLAANVGDD
jgi:uncharacterized protein (TIGR02453 family)